ncbi:MAG: hypothetical protein RLP02_10285 [Coleofasciculus sp. C2-GNP5-27]
MHATVGAHRRAPLLPTCALGTDVRPCHRRAPLAMYLTRLENAINPKQ